MCVIPQTEEIGLQIITTAEISNKFFRGSPRILMYEVRMGCIHYTVCMRHHVTFDIAKWAP